ncbi:nucleotidyl transferase AbiEii/AbiGii toxin family protein [Staphylococcus schleiferi subsp. coagulans]|uniref:Nucleotidyl transferase AbiEii/AbiGii toxin family protein n=1 Tax=Staphylococcus coagulans TaxID=74706 RepID=A0A9X0PGF2_9STAP|nr:nucleotidyl transferase AbiEii/AbiGii toxin family protein [Staphylococcus coagulans]MBA8777357.1 nucleotidyl transferase AbiEii/AbiGii toxin family protein [Staphylococcus coagulans]
MDSEIIKRTTLKAIFLDERLENILTLKGGNALHLHGLTKRESQDLDFSIRESIRLAEKNEGVIFENNIKKAFEEKGYHVISYKFQDKPKVRDNKTPPFWGGYMITFSIIKYTELQRLESKGIQNFNAYAESMGDGSKKIKIDLSFEEYTDPRTTTEIDGVKIYLYSPLMIVYEKIRASCQQLKEYELSSDKTRARDLYDIYSILTNISNVELREEVVNPNNFHILRRMFELKEVPIELIPKVKKIKDRLLQDYKQTVLPQIPANAETPDFEYLFMYNIELFDELYISLKNNE